MDSTHQATLSMGFPRQEDWSGLPFPSPRDLPRPEIEYAPSALASRFFFFFNHQATRKALCEEVLVFNVEMN